MASALLLAALALADPVAPPIALDALFDFSDPAHCVPAPAFQAVLDKLWGWSSGQQAPLAPEPYRAAFGQVTRIARNNGGVVMSVSIQGSWQGLAVTGIDISRPPGEARGFQLVFRAPAEKVAATLAPLGFEETTMKVRADTGELSAPTPRLVPQGDLTALRCPLPTVKAHHD